jgi:hypothetical protein
MTDSITVPLADTSDMAQVHQVFREAIGAAAPLVGSATPGNAERVELVATYYDNVLRLLHAHHEGEDVLLWPRLLERVPGQAAMVERVAAQHEAVSAALALAHERLAAWRTAPDIDSGAALAAALADLGAQLFAHLDEEEQLIVPLAATCITAPEWGELPGHAMQHFDGDKLWLILGLVREQMRPDQIAVMEAHMPPPLLGMWQSIGQQQFDEFVAELRR